MPYARVGAMPQPMPQSERQSHQEMPVDRSGRQQGITMEDLKKQTALRLAQEQQQSRLFSGFQTQLKQGDAQVLPEQQPHARPHYAYDQPHSMSVPDHNGIDFVPGSNRSPHKQSAAHFPTHDERPLQPVIEKPSKQKSQKPLDRNYGAAIQNNGHELIQGGKPVVRYNGDSVNQRGSRYPKLVSASSGSLNSSGSCSSQLDSSSLHQKQSSKSKLPHGLTVHELKEMTKARLQAEAAERQEFDKQTMSEVYGKNVILPGGSPAVALGQHRNAPMHNGGSHTNPLMPLGFQERMPSHPSNSSLASAGRFDGVMYPQNHLAVVQGRDAWQQQSALDAWETTSVASMNSTIGSEYLGSEAAYPGGMSGLQSQATDDMAAVPFCRSVSYGGAFERRGLENNSTPSFASNGSYYDFPVGGSNRRRACTLSPRPGLSYLHEDRPLMTSGPGLALPAFESGPRSILPGRSNEATFIEPIARGSSPAQYWTNQNGGVIGGGLSMGFNRPRTASAPSVTEFLARGSNSFTQFQPSHSLGREGLTSSSGRDFSDSIIDSVIGARSGNSDYSSVFRNPNSSVGGGSRPPPGLFSSLDSSGSSIFPAGGSTDRDDVWGMPITHEEGITLGSNSTLDEDASLADNLGSILKLSGDEEALSAYNEVHLVSRIDPQVSDDRDGKFRTMLSSSFHSGGRSSAHENIDIGSANDQGILFFDNSRFVSGNPHLARDGGS